MHDHKDWYREEYMRLRKKKAEYLISQAERKEEKARTIRATAALLANPKWSPPPADSTAPGPEAHASLHARFVLSQLRGTPEPRTML